MKARTLARILLVCFVGVCARAQAANTRFVRVEPGLGGVVKIGSNAAVRVLIEHSGADTVRGRLVISALDGLGRALASTEREVVLPTRSRKEFSLPVLMEYGTFALEAAVWQGKRRLARKVIEPTVASMKDSALVVLGEDLLEIERLTGGLTLSHGRLSRYDSRDRFTRIGVLNHWNALPTLAAGYEGVDTIVTAEPPPANWREPQRRAFMHWLDRGGMLIACAGAAPSVWKASALAARLPVTLGDDLRLTDLQPLRALAHAERRTPPPGEQLAIPSRLRAGAQLLAGDQRLPLIVRGAPSSSERDVWVAFDPRREPFRSWRGRQDFWRSLLRWTPSGRSGGRFDGLYPGTLPPLLKQARVAGAPTRKQFLRPIISFTVVSFLATLWLARRRKDAIWLVLSLGGTAFAFAYSELVAARLQRQAQLVGVTTRLLDPKAKFEQHTASAEFFLPRRMPLDFAARVGANATEQNATIRFWGSDYAQGSYGLNHRFGEDGLHLRVQCPSSWALHGLMASREALRAGSVEATLQQRGERFHYRLVNRTQDTLRDGVVAVFVPISPQDPPSKQWSCPVPTLPPGATAEVTLAPSTVTPDPGSFESFELQELAKRLDRARGNAVEPLIRKFLLAQIIQRSQWRRARREGGPTFVAFTDRAPFALESPQFRSRWRHLVVVPLPGVHPDLERWRRARGGSTWNRADLMNADLIALTAEQKRTRFENVKLHRGEAVLEFTLDQKPKARWVNVALQATPKGKARVACAAYNWRTGQWHSWQPLKQAKGGHNVPFDCRHPVLGLVHVRLIVSAPDEKSHLELTELQVKLQ